MRPAVGAHGPIKGGNCVDLAVAIGLAAPASAQSITADFTMPGSAFYVGLGGSFNAVNFGSHNVTAVGTSGIFQNGALIGNGRAAGPGADIGMDSDTTFSPSVAGGYFQHFANSDWLWGVRFSYNYVNAGATTQNALLPQIGSFTLDNTTVPFVGSAVVHSLQTKLVHQMNLMPFIGHSFGRGFVYAGLGPTLAQTQTNLDGLVGFADVRGNATDVSGAPQNLTSTGCVFGGAAMLGTTYFLTDALFLDLNYTLSQTVSTTSDYSSVYVNPNGQGGTTTVGTLVGSSTGSAMVQSVTLTINLALP